VGGRPQEIPTLRTKWLISVPVFHYGFCMPFMNISRTHSSTTTCIALLSRVLLTEVSLSATDSFGRSRFSEGCKDVTRTRRPRELGSRWLVAAARCGQGVQGWPRWRRGQGSRRHRADAEGAGHVQREWAQRGVVGARHHEPICEVQTPTPGVIACHDRTQLHADAPSSRPRPSAAIASMTTPEAPEWAQSTRPRQQQLHDALNPKRRTPGPVTMVCWTVSKQGGDQPCARPRL
jgi:hypothetical protein